MLVWEWDWHTCYIRYRSGNETSAHVTLYTRLRIRLVHVLCQMLVWWHCVWMSHLLLCRITDGYAVLRWWRRRSQNGAWDTARSSQN